ncbi:MAG TPA: N-acyl-D-glucosamine 2-epimerase, partial [Candidatus Dormibacteraeota bacterium]
MNEMHFTFSDTIAGYVTRGVDEGDRTFLMRTSDGRDFAAEVTDATYAEVIRNPDEPFQDPGAPLAGLLVPGRFVFAYGVFYPEAGGTSFQAKHVVLVGGAAHEWRFESPGWWIDQVRGL